MNKDVKKNHKKKVIYISLGIIILLALYLLKDTSYILRLSSFIFSVIVFYLADKFFKLDFNKTHYLLFILISASGILLSPLYFIFPSYDKALHLLSPFLMGIIIFFLVNKTDLKLSTKLLMTFSIVVMFLAIFEIGEFSLDRLFDLKLQGVFLRDASGLDKLNIVMDRNDDTMIDLILGTIGVAIFAGYKAIETKVKNKKK